ncbi:uncharacterized vacuolar membrane protein YML018C-like [Carica papaya]|uniref:uncharacterized vacuolar membrane protein YML018C-like n=1 Tax=Carica papaya TaxID=3649 RepID=UPI000B8CFEF8|nr:uncharacterized vacuolar membrane protein YML018C-like [Carica papaya]
MAWKYRAGLVLMVIVLFIWVTSSEITQGIFTSYRHPFAVAYLGTSLLIVHLPIAFAKDWLLRFLSHRRRKQKPSAESDSQLKHENVSVTLENHDLRTPLMADNANVVDKLDKNRKLTRMETLVFGFCIAPVWFLTEYLTNAALARTSVANTTLLGSTSGLFTLLIGAALGQDSINSIKVISVVISLVGASMTTFGSTWFEDQTAQYNMSLNTKHSLLGDLFAFLSAMTYGLFSVLLQKFSGEQGERVDIQKLYGYIGLFTFLGLWWVVWPLSAAGMEPKFEFPHSARIGGIILLDGIVGNVFSDYLWALVVVWTSPLVAALGYSLTIPLAMLEDILIHKQGCSLIYIIGSAQVFLGFVIANLSDWISQRLRWEIFNNSFALPIALT